MGRIGQTAWNKGKKLSAEHKYKLSLSHKGKMTWSKGKKLSLEHREKLSKVKMGKYREENSPHWKGNNISYRSLHKWVSRNLGKANKCANNINHKSTRYHWSNVSKQYKRDLKDWLQLCPSCNSLDRIGRRVSP